jgi:hypothetical protein
MLPDQMETQNTLLDVKTPGHGAKCAGIELYQYNHTIYMFILPGDNRCRSMAFHPGYRQAGC